MNGGFGPGLGVSSSPLMGGNNSGSSRRFARFSSGLGAHMSHTSSHGSSYSERIQPHPSHYRHPHPHSRPNARPGPVGTIAPGAGKWMVPLCYEPENDVSTCCLGCWCPQILYGRTQFRLRRMAQNKDPLDLTEFKVFNGPCGTFMVAEYLTAFSCIFIMLQHSRVRAMYSIDGTAADDCCSSYACPNCTLMQDDREIRAREFKDGKNEKGFSAVTIQPSIQPDMQYDSPSLFRDQKFHHRGSVAGENATVAMNGQSPHVLGNSKLSHEHKKLHKLPKADKHVHKPFEKGKLANNNNDRVASNDAGPYANPPTHKDHEDRDAILASRQKWRNQNLSGKPEARPEYTLAPHPRRGTIGSENDDSVIHCRTPSDYSDAASVNHIKGKGDLKQLDKVEGRHARSMASNVSESYTNESVIVFYGDGERPQRHSLADCARIRASTLGRTDAPYQNDFPTGRHEKKAVGGSGSPKALNLHDMNAYPEVVVTEDLKPLDPQHFFEGCAVEDKRKTKEIELCYNEIHSGEKFAGNTRTTKNKASCSNTSKPESIEQHLLKECAINQTLDSLNAKLAKENSQILLSKKDREHVPVEPNAPDQHGNDDCGPAGDAQATDKPSPGQHVITKCAVTANDAQSEASEGAFPEYDRPKINFAGGQSESQSVIRALPEPPIIVVTGSEPQEETTGEHHGQRRSKSPKIVATSEDSTKSTEHKAPSSNLAEDRGGVTDTKNGQSQLGEAAAALRKVLNAAADLRHGKAAAEFIGDDPTEVNVSGVPEGVSIRSRTKAVGGRAQKNKGK